MAKLKENQEVDVHNGTLDASGFEGRGTLVRYMNTAFAPAIGGRYDGKKVEFEQWRVRMNDGGEEKTRYFVVEDLQPQLTGDDIQKLIREQGLTVTAVIDAVIELNGFVGVGLISLGDDLQAYCRNKIKKRAA